MIDFFKEDGKVILTYRAQYSQQDWVSESLKEDQEVTIKKTFYFTSDDIYILPEEDEEVDPIDEAEIPPVHFVFANREKNYYKIKPGILTDKFDLYLHEDVIVSLNLFVADTNMSIIHILEDIVTTDVYIGGSHRNAIPEEGYLELIKNFPNNYEKKKYVRARVTSILREYLDGTKDAETAYHRYMNKRVSRIDSNLKKTFKESELEKYQTILQRLTAMLKSEDGYSEKQWQEEILQILLLINPKYIFVFREVPIKDRSISEKYLDYLLVDSNGYTDLIEIKRPFDKSILSKDKYRNNHIPLRELSGTIMQVEKYIFYLNRWGKEGEGYLTNKYKDELPANFEIKITNPSGTIIMGREKNLSLDQKIDFEVVKRKYKNVVDIITYDNLILRLKSTIDQIKKI